jgi:hypothetical protein
MAVVVKSIFVLSVATNTRQSLESFTADFNYYGYRDGSQLTVVGFFTELRSS